MADAIVWTPFVTEMAASNVTTDGLTVTGGSTITVTGTVTRDGQSFPVAPFTVSPPDVPPGEVLLWGIVLLPSNTLAAGPMGEYLDSLDVCYAWVEHPVNDPPLTDRGVLHVIRRRPWDPATEGRPPSFVRYRSGHVVRHDAHGRRWERVGIAVPHLDLRGYAQRIGLPYQERPT